MLVISPDASLPGRGSDARGSDVDSHRKPEVRVCSARLGRYVKHEITARARVFPRQRLCSREGGSAVWRADRRHKGRHCVATGSRLFASLVRGYVYFLFVSLPRLLPTEFVASLVHRRR